MSHGHRMGIWVLAATLLTSGCYGPFNLTRRLYRWNGQIEGKWEKEFMFILLAWAPVYGLTVAGDALIFNAMEFWTGNNPVDPPPPGGKGALPSRKRLARGEAEALLTYTPAADGGQLLVEQFLSGQPAGSLRIERRNGIAVGADAEGRTVLTAETLADGGVLVRSAEGRQVASYSADEVERFFRSVKR